VGQKYIPSASLKTEDINNKSIFLEGFCEKLGNDVDRNKWFRFRSTGLSKFLNFRLEKSTFHTAHN